MTILSLSKNWLDFVSIYSKIHILVHFFYAYIGNNFVSLTCNLASNGINRQDNHSENKVCCYE